MPSRRTTHRSTAGTKLYAVRGKDGAFKDIQTYKRAHGQDIKRTSEAERQARARKSAAAKRNVGRSAKSGRRKPGR
jgi:hypothetical protein